MQFHVVTIFPELFASPLSVSLLKKAQDRGLVTCHVHNLRDYTADKHRSTDDAPYGGGPGMVMKPEPIFAALEALGRRLERPKRLLLSPQGTPLTQQRSASWPPNRLWSWCADAMKGSMSGSERWSMRKCRSAIMC